ncbi:MAG: hypothetical protein WDW36_010258 [Sanguina aurantia]
MRLEHTTSPAQPYQHPLTNMPPAGPGLTTGYFFPDHANKNFPAGELVKVVLGIHNEGPETYNITAVMGSINAPNDFKVYVQNLTRQMYMQMLEPGQELSLEYTMMPSKDLPARDFIMAITLFYSDKRFAMKSSTFFNSTVEVVEVKKFIDTDLLFLYLLLLSIFGAAGYFLLQYIQGLGFLKNVGKKSKRVETSQRDSDDEWLKGSNYEAVKRKQKAKSAAAAAKRAA